MTKSQPLHIEEIPSAPTPSELSRDFFDAPHAILLESSLGGRYSIGAFAPSVVLKADEPHFLERWQTALRETPRVDAPDLPFATGWIGYLSYELYEEIEKKVAPRATSLIPKAVMAYYDRFYLFDHQTRRTFFVTAGLGSPGGGLPPGPAELARRPAEIFRDRPGGAQKGSSAPTASPLPASASFSGTDAPREDHLAKVGRIKTYIADGDCYQVNLSQKFTIDVAEPPALIYRRLRASSPAPYSAYLNLGDAQILSSSPELFLELDGKKVTTRPIKGTRPRGADAAQDAAMKASLAASDKDRAELLMITDLERNDLGRICRPGSVRVTDLRKIETYPQVHHLVSTIEGELKPDNDIVDLLKATFPGGSITGAPKVRAMQVIRELEPHAREIYCGAIGYVSANGKAQFNVAIRTMVVQGGQARFWSGGGIVADSEPMVEYEETLVKAAGLRRALGLES